MELNRRECILGSLSAATLTLLPWRVFAQSRTETLRHLIGGTIATLDPSVPGATREAWGASMCIYDRLIGFGTKIVDGNPVFDQSQIIPELAERFEIAPNGLKITLYIRKNATWHDGTPVTEEDIKWSLDRAVTAESLAPAQLSSGGMTRADQFRIAGPGVVEIHLDEPNRLALPNLGMPFVNMVNSKLLKQHVTDDDPWALKWAQNNHAGSGAYKVSEYRPGEQIVLERNEEWACGVDGKLPNFKTVICQTVADPATRTNLIEKGDADLVLDLQASDIEALRQRGSVKIVSNALTNGFTFIAMNTQKAPFDNVKVRRAIAAALPYEDMFKAGLFERGKRLYDGEWKEGAPSAEFPIPMPVKTDLDQAKKLLEDAGYPDGFETTFSFTLAFAAVAEPIAALVQEALGKIGIRVAIQKLPHAQFSEAHVAKNLEFFIETGSAWLPETFYFFWVYFTRDQRWNHASWNNQRVNELVDLARAEIDEEKYQAYCKEMISILAHEVPMVLLWQQNVDAVMREDVDGYVYHYHRQADYRDLSRV